MESEGLRSEMKGKGLRVTDGGWGLEIGEMEDEGWDRTNGGWGLKLELEGEGLRDGG